MKKLQVCDFVAVNHLSTGNKTTILLFDPLSVFLIISDFKIFSGYTVYALKKDKAYPVSTSSSFTNNSQFLPDDMSRPRNQAAGTNNINVGPASRKEILKPYLTAEDLHLF